MLCLQLALEFDDTLAFPVYLPSPAAAGSAVQLEPLTPGATAGSAILGIANYEARVQLPDHAMALGSEEPGTGAIANVAGDLAELQRTFSQLLPLPRASQQEFGVWHSAFRAFVKAVVERRGQHVELWLNTNMASFLDDPEALAIQVGRLSDHLLMLQCAGWYRSACSADTEMLMTLENKGKYVCCLTCGRQCIWLHGFLCSNAIQWQYSMQLCGQLAASRPVLQAALACSGQLSKANPL